MNDRQRIDRLEQDVSTLRFDHDLHADEDKATIRMIKEAIVWLGNQVGHEVSFSVEDCEGCQ